jgi:hypothetical protein
MAKLKNCKTCNHEVAKSAKTCPSCGAKLKMGFLAKAGIAVAALIILGIIASSGGDDSSNTATTASTSNAKSSDAKNDQPKPLSNEGVSSDVKIKVEGVESTKELGDNQFSKKEAQGVFKVVKLTITNNQKDAVTIDSDSFKLIDDKGREFSNSTDGQLALETSVETKKESFFLKQLNPGLTVTGHIVFEVPEDAKGFKLQGRGGMTGKKIELKVE